MNTLITGANQGIGYYMAVELLDQGHSVTILDLEIDELLKLKEKYAGRLFPIECDVRFAEAIDKAVKMSVEAFGTVDIAIHNACRCTFNAMKETDYEVYTDVFDVNYYGALRLTKSVLPIASIWRGKSGAKQFKV
jgi:gluconate 5-dehydrogenase